MRLNTHRRGSAVTIVVDGEAVVAYLGESLGAALLALGRRTLRTTPKYGAPRGMFCGMGVCFDCMVRLGEGPAVRACLTPVQSGMRVETGVRSEGSRTA